MALTLVKRVRAAGIQIEAVLADGAYGVTAALRTAAVIAAQPPRRWRRVSWRNGAQATRDRYWNGLQQGRNMLPLRI